MRILFVCPVLDIRHEWFSGFVQVWEDLRMHQGWEVGLYAPYRVPVPVTENTMVKKALEEKFEYILRMDDDIWDVPKGAIDELLKADKEFISAVMFAHGFPYQQCALTKQDKSLSLVRAAKENIRDLVETRGEGVQPCDLTAFPFTLFKTSMFERLPQPWFEHAEDCPSDNYFCQKLLDNGIQPYVHMGLPVTHRGVTFWNRLYFMASEGRQRINCGLIKPEDSLYKTILEVEAIIKNGLIDIENKSKATI